MLGLTDPSVVNALRTLDGINASLRTAVSQAATGKAVATAADSSAAYVNALGLNSDAQAFMAVNNGLGGAEVPARVAGAAIDQITGVLANLQNASIEAQSGGVSGAAASTQIQALLSQISNYESDATVNGVNLVAGAVVNDVSLTQIHVPTDPDGNMLTIGDTGLSQMNASLPGLGLDNFSGTQDGLSIDFSSLSVENISTSLPPTQIQVQTANYGNGETPQYPGQSWTFVFTNAPASDASVDSNSVSDAAGNITHVDHTIPVPLPVGFSLNDAMTALQSALFAAGFESQFTASSPSTGAILSIAGNNVGTVAPPVQNLRPSLPIAVGAGSATMTAAVNATGTPTQITINSPSLPSGDPPSSLVGATFLSTQAEIDAFSSSNPTAPAFYLLPPSAAIPPGTTIQSVSLASPTTYNLVLSPPGATVNIPITSIGLLIPLPSTPVASPTLWGGAAGAIATLTSALRKTGEMAQTLGNSINILQQMQAHATQSVDSLDSGIGNLTDADMGNVSADIQSLQIRQQLATQSLTVGEQWPVLLLQLFR
jgi:flagellin